MGNASKSKLKNSQAFEAWFYVIVILLAFSLVFVILNKTWSDIKNPLAAGLNSSVPEADRDKISSTIEQTGGAGLMFDKLMPFLIIGLFAFVLILAGGIIQHPIMIVVGIIILGVVITIAVVYSNIYNEITSTDEFSSTKADMPISDKFMQYLPYVAFIMAIGIAIAIIWSRRGGGGTL